MIAQCARGLKENKMQRHRGIKNQSQTNSKRNKMMNETMCTPVSGRENPHIRESQF